MDRDIQIFREGFKQGVEMFAIWKDGDQLVGAMRRPIKEIYREVDGGAFDFAFTNRDFATDTAHLEHGT